MADDAKVAPPPYLPYRTFRGYLDGLRAAGIPAKIDRSVLRNRSGTEQTMLINALQYLGLITVGGIPTAGLTKMVESEGAERAHLLHDLLVTRYPFLFTNGFNLQTASPSMVQEAFSNAGVSGDTIRKAVAFFLSAAKEAQIAVSQYLKVRPGRGVRRRQRGAGQQNGEVTPPAATPPPPPSAAKSPMQTLIDILDPDAMSKEEQDAVWVLIRYLKKPAS